MNKLSVLVIPIVLVALHTLATPLTTQEKFDFQKSSVPSCIAKNNATRDLTVRQKEGINNYCICHGAVMASLATREEMIDISKGKLPAAFQGKVVEAQKQCIKALSN